MPVTYILEDGQQLVVTTASGILSREEILQHLGAKTASGVLATPELFDARDVTLDLSVADLQIIADQVRSAMAGIQPGRTAVVTTNNFISGFAETYKKLAAEDAAQLEIFQHVEDARKWLLQS